MAVLIEVSSACVPLPVAATERSYRKLVTKKEATVSCLSDSEQRSRSVQLFASKLIAVRLTGSL